MRALVQFVGLIAAGLIAVVAISGGALRQLDADALAAGVLAWRGLDLPSLVIGLAMGISLGAMTGIAWSELPRRFLNWLAAMGPAFRWSCWAALALAVLLYY